MTCPYCDTDLRIDTDIDDDGRVEVEVSCQNDSKTRTENCLSGIKVHLNLVTETGVWALRSESTNG